MKIFFKLTAGVAFCGILFLGNHSCFLLNAKEAPSSTKSINLKENVKENEAVMLSPKGIPTVWVQGEAVTEFEKDQLYIFECWATWCRPCVAAMPHLQALYEQANKENVSVKFVGVNIWENKSKEDLVKFFKEKMPTIKYPIAMDNPKDKNVERNWIKPLNIRGIPYAMAVKNGQIIWDGHPNSLTFDLIKSMTSVDFKSVTKKNYEYKRPVKKETDKRVDLICDLLKDGKYDEAKRRADIYLSMRSITNEKRMEVIFLPVSVAISKKDWERFQISCLDIVNQYPEDQYVLSCVIGLTSFVAESLKKDFNYIYIEKAMQNLIKIKEAQKIKPESFAKVWEVYSNTLERLGKLEEAKNAKEKLREYKNFEKKESKSLTLEKK